MAPHTPHRSARPGGAVARLDTPTARHAPAEPWRASIPREVMVGA
jgi:hypothetical protein